LDRAMDGKKPIPESAWSFIAGVSILCTSLLALLFVLPRVAPYYAESCHPFALGTGCSPGINPLHPMAFVISIAATLLLLFGLFGRGFLRLPFAFGIILLVLGLFYAVPGFLGLRACGSGGPVRMCSSMAYPPEFLLAFHRSRSALEMFPGLPPFASLDELPRTFN
jgi:hypothetical protein